VVIGQVDDGGILRNPSRLDDLFIACSESVSVDNTLGDLDPGSAWRSRCDHSRLATRRVDPACPQTA